MALWTVERQSYDQTEGLILDAVGSGFFTLPNIEPTQQRHYLWWRHDKNSGTIDGHFWWENTTLPTTRTDDLLGLEDLVFLKFSSDEANFNYFFAFTDRDPAIFKTQYQWPISSSSSFLYIEDSYDPSDLENLTLLLQPEYKDLTPQTTESFRQSQETQVRELLYIANHQCCTCEQPAASCPGPKVPESTPTASLLLLGIFGIILLLKRNLKPAHHEKTKLL